MYYSIGIYRESDDTLYDLYEEFALIPTSRPVISPPAPKLRFEEIPGGSGSLDLSTVVSNKIEYYDRTGSLEFMFAPRFPVRDGLWEDIYRSLVRILSSSRIRLYTSSNAKGESQFDNYYYQGRMMVNEWKTDKTWEKVTIDYRLDPFKYSDTLSTLGPYTLNYGDTRGINIVVDHTTIPTITVSKNMTIRYNGVAYLATPGGYNQIALVDSGTNNFTVSNTLNSGSGTVYIEWRDVSL